MTHEYSVTGMTCAGCEAKIKFLLEKIPQVNSAVVDLERGTVAVSMAQHIATEDLQAAIKDYPKYQLSEIGSTAQHNSVSEEDSRTWWETYRPILLVFGYITCITLLIEMYNGQFDMNNWMNNFMAGFFLVFSFFKMLNLKGFAESYLSYDIIAKKWMSWGYVYAFLELALGVAYLLRFEPLLTNAVTFVVMSLSIIGVLQSVMNKRKIKCACLGAVFNLPMSTVTIIEDAIMIVMSGAMVVSML